MKYKHLAHATFNVSDMEKALKFYCDGLGMKFAYSMTFETLYDKLKKDIADNTIPVGMNAEERLKFFEAMKDKPWLIYLQVAEGQFLELFYTYNDEPLLGDTSQKCGYQHLCLEVGDIHAAWDEVTANGIKPTSAINLGPDGSYQFWVADPDGNRIELMQYTEQSLQVIHAVEE